MNNVFTTVDKSSDMLNKLLDKIDKKDKRIAELELRLRVAEKRIHAFDWTEYQDDILTAEKEQEEEK